MKLRELTRQPARPILVRCPVGRNGPRIGISYDPSCHRSFTSVHRSCEYHSPLPPLTHSIVEPPVWTTRWAPDRHHGILIRSSTHVIVRAKEKCGRLRSVKLRASCCDFTAGKSNFPIPGAFTPKIFLVMQNSKAPSLKEARCDAKRRELA